MWSHTEPHGTVRINFVHWTCTQCIPSRNYQKLPEHTVSQLTRRTHRFLEKNKLELKNIAVKYCANCKQIKRTENPTP